jgi:hypothetical protein
MSNTRCTKASRLVPNPYSQYVLPTMYAVAEQQRINNWDSAINFSFVGAGAHYMRTLSLRTLYSRRIQVGDIIVFCIAQQYALLLAHCLHVVQGCRCSK